MATVVKRMKSGVRSCLCDCSCVRWSCWSHWRQVCKPLMVAVYLVILFIFLPLLIYWLYEEHAEDQFKAWFVAGIFMLLTFPIFLLGLTQHLLNYTQPHLQKHIIRYNQALLILSACVCLLMLALFCFQNPLDGSHILLG